MGDIAIRVENLGERYRIGRAKERHDTLRRSSHRGEVAGYNGARVWRKE